MDGAQNWVCMEDYMMEMVYVWVGMEWTDGLGGGKNKGGEGGGG